MNPIKNNGNYFIKDAELSDAQYDKFKHADISKNIINIIENNAAPFNVAIVGKWGLGKSSLINMVKQNLSVQKDKYIIEDVNAWKYEKEALKRVLLRKILSNLDYTDKSALAEFIDGLKAHKGEVTTPSLNFWQRLKTEWTPLLFDALLIYVLGVLLSLLGQYLISQVNASVWDFNSWVTFILNGFSSNFYIPLLVVLFEKYINTSKEKYNFKITPPMTSVDEYERELESRLTKAKYKDKKIIIIVDDLDRLTPNKIVEALDAIKAFVGYPNFIFIVPFDDTILRDAIKQEKTNFACNEHLTIESDLFLDKLFQYKIFLPNIIQSNIPQYAIEAAQKDAKDLVDLCGKEDFELLCKEILIHKKVTTPRQAKKVVNTFANNLLLAYRRESQGIAPGAFTSLQGKRFLAKISVLQSDFPSFYSNLFIDNTLIKNFLNLTDQEQIDKITTDLLAPYFTLKENHYILSKTGESLSMFLHRTSSITSDNIARFLYLNDDRLSELFGNEFSLVIRDGLTSGDYKLVREKIQENSEKDISTLLYEVLSNSDPIDFEFCCIGIINVSDIIAVKEDKRLVSLLDSRLSSIFTFQKIIDAKNLNIVNAIELFHFNNNLNGINQLILNQCKNEENNFLENLSIFFQKENILSNSVKLYIKEWISIKCSTPETNFTFDDLFEIKALNIGLFFKEYLSDSGMFERLFKWILAEDNYDIENAVVVSFVELFEKHLQQGNADQALKIVCPNLNHAEFAELVIQHIEKYAGNFKNVDIASAAFINLIEASNDTIRSLLNQLLSKSNWKITPTKNEIVDKYLNQNLDDKYINAILLIIASNNQVKLIPQTVKSIHSMLFNVKVEIATIYELQKQYDNGQLTELIEVLKPIFASSASDENTLKIATNLLGLLSQDDKNKTYITQVAEYIYSQTVNYPNNMVNKTRKMLTFKKSISTTSVQSFISWASSHISAYPLCCITVLHVFKEEIPPSDYVALGSSIINYTTPDTLGLSLSLLRLFQTEFEKQPNQNALYKNFLVAQLNNANYRKSIIKDIMDSSSNISDVNKLIAELVKYNDIIEESIAAIVKFTEGSSREQILSIAKSVIATSSINHLNNVHSIFLGWLEKSYSIIIADLLESTDTSISIIYGINLMSLSIKTSDISMGLKIKGLCILLDICDDATLPEIIALGEQIGRLNNKLEKRQLGASLYKAFRNTPTESLKIQVFSLVKSTSTRSAFETDEQSNKREFSDKEIDLVKHSK